MDSFFKAAVCDLDKLLDDFELSSEELDCNPVFLKPTVYSFSSATSSWPSSEASAVSTSLPDLNSLHYGSPSHFPEHFQQNQEEAAVQPLTGVDLLSSVNGGQTQSSAPPCPDQTLKPVCDLVNDTSSAMLIRDDSHDAFSELDVVERQMEQEEALLVVFDKPLVSEEDGEAAVCERSAEQQFDPTEVQNSDLASLDIILPLAIDQVSEMNSCVQEQTEESADGVGLTEETSHSAIKETEPSAYSKEESAGSSEESKPESSDCQPIGLSCLPLAVSMCGALVNHTQEYKDCEKTVENRDVGVSESAEAQSPSALDTSEQSLCHEEPAPSEDSVRLSPVGGSSDVLLPDDHETSPVDRLEFGFEYLPESDQAEMLVTDEELDAFLQAHNRTEEVRSVSCRRSVDYLDHERVLEEELTVCGEIDGDALEGLASPESDRTMLASVEGNVKLGATSDPSSSPPSSSTFQSQQQNVGTEQHGGARPKTLHGLNSPPPPAAEEEEEEEPNSSTSPAELTSEEPSEYSSQDQDQVCGAYDELSEPPPYPGEPAAVSAPSADWKRDEDAELGNKQPAWVPDADAPNCMNCSQKFTFTRRRHHCRACGKVFCGVCCNRKCKLKYLEKEARVCVVCFDSIRRAEALERMMSPTGPSPNPNIPSEYCSTIPPLQQARAAGTLNSPPPTVMVPVSVLKQPTTEGCPREQKRVWFADGILPNGEFADTTKLSVTSRRSGELTPDQTPSPAGSESGSADQSAPEPSGAAGTVRPLVDGPWDIALLSAVSSSVKMVHSLLPDNVEELPPLLITTGEQEVGDVLVEESPAPCQILRLLEEGGPRPLMFVLNANLLVNVKIVTYEGRQCWCFGSTGLQALGQKELVFLLECLPEEKTLPQDLFTLYLNIYQDAQNGKFLDELDNITFTSSFLGSKDHAGMLFFAPSCQDLLGLSLPPQPFLFGLLVQKLEVPWAKVFPLRLLLRLGSEYRVYPTTLVSVRFRDSVYRETGHTIMNLLSDLRNYQYSLSVVDGLRIHMEMGRSYIDIPKSSFAEMLKVVNSSNEHVISVGATFSPEADSHLVCFQTDEGNYQTQANSSPGKTRTVTGASFVVFNGALKPSSGFIAKSSIVEDGLMVQIPPETMEALRVALREQRDLDIPCGKSDEAELRETVTVRWTDWSPPLNKGKSSGVDGRPLDGVHSVRVQQDTEFVSDGRSIRCTEVFCQLKSPDSGSASAMVSCGGFQKDIALATCSALTPHLPVLLDTGFNSVSLRVSTQPPDTVEYQAGSRGRLLPQRYMNELDGALIPVIHGGGASVPQTPLDLEFVFYVTHSF